MAIFLTIIFRSSQRYAYDKSGRWLCPYMTAKSFFTFGTTYLLRLCSDIKSTFLCRVSSNFWAIPIWSSREISLLKRTKISTSLSGFTLPRAIDPNTAAYSTPLAFSTGIILLLISCIVIVKFYHI